MNILQVVRRAAATHALKKNKCEIILTAKVIMLERA